MADVDEASLKIIRPVSKSTEIRIRRLKSSNEKYSSSLSQNVIPSVSAAILSKIVRAWIFVTCSTSFSAFERSRSSVSFWSTSTPSRSHLTPILVRSQSSAVRPPGTLYIVSSREKSVSSLTIYNLTGWNLGCCGLVEDARSQYCNSTCSRFGVETTCIQGENRGDWESRCNARCKVDNECTRWNRSMVSRDYFLAYEVCYRLQLKEPSYSSLVKIPP